MTRTGAAAPQGPPAAAHPDGRRRSLGDLAKLFLRLGLTAFGGPAAHIAFMEEEVVRRRGWLTREEFLDRLGAANLIPGPTSTELVIHIGLRRGGWPGLVVAGACFIIPAAVLSGILAWAYVRFGGLPQVGALLYGVKPVIIAIVLHALWRLGRAAIKTASLGVLALVAVAACLAGVNVLVVLLGAGALLAALRYAKRLGPSRRAAAALLAAGPIALGATAPAPFSLGALFLFFLKVGAVLFGSGYVLLAFLREDLVEKWHWLTEGQLLDAVAAGQITPGPVFSTATFIGYLLGGTRGALLATIGIFVPAFVFVAASAPFIGRLRRWPAAASFLDGVNAAALALMAVVTWRLADAALVDLPAAALGVAAFLTLSATRVNPAWIVLAGGAAGAAIHWLRPA